MNVEVVGRTGEAAGENEIVGGTAAGGVVGNDFHVVFLWSWVHPQAWYRPKLGQSLECVQQETLERQIANVRSGPQWVLVWGVTLLVQLASWLLYV